MNKNTNSLLQVSLEWFIVRELLNDCILNLKKRLNNKKKKNLKMFKNKKLNEKSTRSLFRYEINLERERERERNKMNE